MDDYQEQKNTIDALQDKIKQQNTEVMEKLKKVESIKYNERGRSLGMIEQRKNIELLQAQVQDCQE